MQYGVVFVNIRACLIKCINIMNTSPQINFTDNAALKVFELISDEEQLDLNLRVSISGGGCSGFQYGFMFDEVIKEDDHVFTAKVGDDKSTTVKLIVDPISIQYLMGADVDYQKDLQGEQFVIRNPNASSTCGCGSSFSI